MAAEWNDENTRILSELFAEQVGMGNRPNTYLTPAAFEEVAVQFKIRTGLEYKHTQIKNKWDKLKKDYNIFKRLKLRETGGGWDHERNTVKQDAEWWKLAAKDINGCAKFKKHGLRNEENLKTCFEDIVSDGTDHWNPSSGAPPPSSAALADALNVDAINDVDEEDIQTPTSVKRLGKFVHDGSKKPRTALVMQEQITRIGNIAERSQSTFESFITEDDDCSVKNVMNAVLECGATEGSDEHYVATELLSKRDQRQIFMHMTIESRLGWLARKYKNKYPN